MLKRLLKKKDEIVHNFLWNLTEKYPDRLRVVQVDGSPYLRRFYITPRRLNKKGEETGEDLGFNIYIHHFYRGDNDRELHNHPWEKAVSLILCGGYKEERKTADGKVKTYNLWPGKLNFLRHTDFHRVIMDDNDKHVWTLFITGKRVQSWGFWNRENNEYVNFEDFVKPEFQGYEQS